MKYGLPANTPVSRRMGHTPLAHVLRGKLSGVLDHQTILANTGLSPEAQTYAQAILSKTRLWTNETTDARDKLIDDLLAREQQGQSIDAIKADMGTPRQAAKAIVIHKRQLRPRWWQVLRISMKTFNCMLLGLIALHLLSGLWFASFDRVVPKVDYLAKINTKAAAVPETQRAWPIYRDAIIATGYQKSDADKLVYRGDSWAQYEPKDKAAAVAVVKEYAVLIDKIREGAKLPGLGLVFPQGGVYTDADAQVMEQLGSKSGTENTFAVTNADALLRSGIEFPAHMSVMSSLSTLIRNDMFIAADNNQMDLVVADLRTQMRLAAQLRELSVYMCQLVSNSTDGRGFLAIAHIMETYADQFTDEQLIELRKLLAMYDPMAAFESKGNRYTLLDTLQRTYAPSGRLATDSLFMEMAKGPKVFDFNDRSAFFAKIMLLPPLNVFMSSRQEVETRITQLQDDTLAYRRLPIWEQLRTTSPYEIYKEIYKAKRGEHRLSKIRSLLAYESTMVVIETDIGLYIGLSPERDAADVAIALEQYRRARGNYPDALAALVPAYLSEPPVDHSTGLPLLYKLVDGKPLLYGRGLDNDDDGGVIDASEKQPAKVPEAGDWILYPLPADD